MSDHDEPAGRWIRLAPRVASVVAIYILAGAVAFLVGIVLSQRSSADPFTVGVQPQSSTGVPDNADIVLAYVPPPADRPTVSRPDLYVLYHANDRDPREEIAAHFGVMDDAVLPTDVNVFTSRGENRKNEAHVRLDEIFTMSSAAGGGTEFVPWEGLTTAPGQVDLAWWAPRPAGGRPPVFTTLARDEADVIARLQPDVRIVDSNGKILREGEGDSQSGITFGLVALALVGLGVALPALGRRLARRGEMPGTERRLRPVPAPYPATGRPRGAGATRWPHGRISKKPGRDSSRATPTVPPSGPSSGRTAAPNPKPAPEPSDPLHSDTAIGNVGSNTNMPEMADHHTRAYHVLCDEPQCPECGSLAVTSSHACGRCGHSWQHVAGEPWPDIVVQGRVDPR